MNFRRTIQLFSLASSLSILPCIESSKAQTLYEQTGDSYLTVAGTSTLHEWTMTSKEGKYRASFEVDEKGTPSKLNSLILKVRSESLKSGHTGMDKNAYSTLNTDVYKTITFNLASATIVSTKIQCEGSLTVAGVTKRISVDATFKVLPDKSLQCSGTKKINMSDFDIEAPSFMFGTVKTGNEMTVSFKVNLVPTGN
jgi:YceI-like domain